MALRIKDNVDLKELKEFGFEKVENMERYEYTIRDNYSRDLSYIATKSTSEDKNILTFCLNNMSLWCNSIEELDTDYKKITESYKAFKEKIKELIEAGLVEKVEDE